MHLSNVLKIQKRISKVESQKEDRLVDRKRDLEREQAKKHRERGEGDL